MYLTYEQYTGMGGTLDSTTFSNYEYEAEATLNWYTFNRLKNWDSYPEEVQRCMVRLVELAKLEAELLFAISGSNLSEGGTSIASQSNDGVSISYNTISASDAFRTLQAKDRGNTIEMTVRRYLSGLKDSKGRNILYRGVYEDE